jgi:hypothetical protein
VSAAAGPPPLWRPYDDAPLLSASMAAGPENVPAAELDALRAYLGALVAARAAPVHVNVAFNAAYFGYDLDAGGYVGGPLDLDALPSVEHNARRPGLPVGALVALVTGSGPMFAEVVYREGAHEQVTASGEVPDWLSGAPAGASDPAAGAEPGDGPVVRAERLVLDFDAFTPGLSVTAAQLERLRQRGRWLDDYGHVCVAATYGRAGDADAGEAQQYQRYLLGPGRDQLMSAVAPMPLSAVLAPGAGDDQLRAALAGVFATVAASLAALPSVRLCGQYAFSRKSFAARLADPGALGGEHLGAIADQLASSAVPSHASRWAPLATVTYTALGPLLGQVPGGRRALNGVGYATVVAHANTVIGDYARGEADPETGLLPRGVHLRVDDTWQCGSIWRARRPGVVPAGADVTDPLGLGWAQATGQDIPALAPSPEPEPETQREPELEEDGQQDEGRLLNVSDSQVMWTQTLHMAHLVDSYLPIPGSVGDLWAAQIADGTEMRLAVYHDGYDLAPDEASQAVTAAQAGGRWRLTGMSWPLAFFAAIVLTCTWARGGRMVRVASTLLYAPVTVDGADIEHRYAPAVLTWQSQPENDPSWAAQVMTAVRRVGLLDVTGWATLPEARVGPLVCGPDPNPADLAAVLAAVDELVAAGRLTRASAGLDRAGDLVAPCPPGAVPVAALVYKPVVVTGPPRRPVPAVLAGLIAAAGLDSRMLADHAVAGHLRRLKPGAHPGATKPAEFAAFRASYGLAGPRELPPGYTFVSPFHRGY